MRIAIISPYDLGRMGGVQNQVLQLLSNVRGVHDNSMLFLGITH